MWGGDPSAITTLDNKAQRLNRSLALRLRLRLRLRLGGGVVGSVHVATPRPRLRFWLMIKLRLWLKLRLNLKLSKLKLRPCFYGRLDQEDLRSLPVSERNINFLWAAETGRLGTNCFNSSTSQNNRPKCFNLRKSFRTVRQRLLN